MVYCSKLRGMRRSELLELCVKHTAIAIMKPLLQRPIETVVEVHNEVLKVHDEVCEEAVEEVLDEMLGADGVLL